MSYKQQVTSDYFRSHPFIGKWVFVIRYWSSFAFVAMLILASQPVMAVFGNLVFSMFFGSQTDWGIAAIEGDVLVIAIVFVVYIIPTVGSM